jgi:hypothetical protein
MIDASQRMIDVQSKVTGEAKEGWGLNTVMKKHLELEIKTLQNAPRDEDKLRLLLELKQRQKQEAMHIEDTQKGWLQRLKCKRWYCFWCVESSNNNYPCIGIYSTNSLYCSKKLKNYTLTEEKSVQNAIHICSREFS